MASSASFVHHFAPGLRDIVGTTLRYWPAYYSRVCNVSTSKRQYEDYLHAAGLPLATSIGERQPTPFFDPLEGDTKRVYHSEWAIGFEVTRNAWADDLYRVKGAIRKAAKSLGRSMAERVEEEVADILNNGFTDYGTIDGASSFFSDSHPRLDGGGNQSNLATGGFTLSTLSEVRTQFYKWTDDRGLRIITHPRTLIVHPDDEFYVNAELRASGFPVINVADQSGAEIATGAGTVNPLRGSFSVLVYPYLEYSGGTPNWYVMGDNHYLQFLWRDRPYFDAYEDKNVRVSKFAAFMRFSVFPLWWPGFVGVNG